MTERIHISPERALDLLELAVQARGADYVDPHCSYSARRFFPDIGYVPGCIIGHALSLAGVPVEALKVLDDSGVESSAIPNLDREGFLDTYGIDLDPDALQAFAVAQEEQDKLKTWGEAVGAARAAVGSE